MTEVERLIKQLSPKYGLDPRAVRAVALGEGGLDWGAVGDDGTSFGPFQLHIGGALPSGRGAGWANSRAGVEYALRSMARSGARGLTGRSAIEAIVRNFERPADPDTSVARAWARYGKGGGGRGRAGGSVVPAIPPPVFGGESLSLGAPEIDRQLLADELLNTPFSQPLDIMRLASLVRGPSQTASAPPRSTSVPVTAEDRWRPRAGGKRGGKWGVTPQLYDFAKRFNLNITSGFRSVAHQRRIYAGRSAPGSAAAPGKSYHNSGRAIDVSVTRASKRAYEWALKHPGLFAEAFWDDKGVYIKNGKLVKGRIGGHSDHIHFAFR